MKDVVDDRDKKVDYPKDNLNLRDNLANENKIDQEGDGSI